MPAKKKSSTRAKKRPGEPAPFVPIDQPKKVFPAHGESATGPHGRNQV